MRVDARAHQHHHIRGQVGVEKWLNQSHLPRSLTDTFNLSLNIDVDSLSQGELHWSTGPGEIRQ